jgi:F-type H+-transporting ATPase subunit b
VDDVKARLAAIAQSQGKRLAKILRNLGEAVGARVAAWKASGESHSLNLQPKAAPLAHGTLTPFTWLLIAASSAGAAAALIIVLGFGFLDNTRATVARINERVTTLDKRVASTERADAALADRVAAAETAMTRNAASANSAIAEIQTVQKALAAQSAQRVLLPGEADGKSADLGHLEKRVAALEGKMTAPETPSRGVQSASSPAESSHGETSFPPFDPANFTPTLVWLTLSFGLLYLLMSKIALPRVENILHSRQDKITSDIAEANDYRAKSEEAAAAHEKLIAEAKAKAVALAQETHAKLNAETEAKRGALEAELNIRLAASEAQIVEMKAKAMSNVEAIANEAAAAIVQRITGRPTDPSAISAAIATVKA